MPIHRAPFSPAPDGVRVALGKDEQQMIRGLAADYRELLHRESQASDPAVARLFPPAYREDPLRNFDYEHRAHDGLMAGRLAAIATLEQHSDAKVLTTEAAQAWLSVLNDLRLVLGTRMDITEDTGEETFSGDKDGGAAFGLYQWLTYLVGTLLEALDPGLIDLAPPGEGDED